MTIFDGLDGEERAFILGICKDDEQFKQYVVADIFHRNRRCKLHADQIGGLRRFRAWVYGGLAAIGATSVVAAIVSWLTGK